jgi:hypothetical protein
MERTSCPDPINGIAALFICADAYTENLNELLIFYLESKNRRSPLLFKGETGGRMLRIKSIHDLQKISAP